MVLKSPQCGSDGVGSAWSICLTKSKHSLFICFIMIKCLVKTGKKNCVHRKQYTKRNSSKPCCTIRGCSIKSPQAHRLLIGPVSLPLKIPLPWLLHSREGKCSLSFHLMGRHWYKKPCSAPGHKKENVYCGGRTKSYFRVRKRESEKEHLTCSKRFLMILNFLVNHHSGSPWRERNQYFPADDCE